MLTGEPENVLPPGVLDHLGRPVASRERGIKPLERGHANAPRAANGEPDAIDPRGCLADELDGRVLAIGGLGEGPRVAEHLAKRVGVQRDDLWTAVDLL